MINRRDLIANRNINKYPAAGLGTLEPHDWLLSMMARKVCGTEGSFPAWEFSSAKPRELISHEWGLDNTSMVSRTGRAFPPLCPCSPRLPSPPLPCPALPSSPLPSPPLQASPPLPSFSPNIWIDFRRDNSCALYPHFVILCLNGQHFIYGVTLLKTNISEIKVFTCHFQPI